jgi:hypothetical protein
MAASRKPLLTLSTLSGLTAIDAPGGSHLTRSRRSSPLIRGSSPPSSANACRPCHCCQDCMGIPFHVPVTDQDTHASHRDRRPESAARLRRRNTPGVQHAQASPSIAGGDRSARCSTAPCRTIWRPGLRCAMTALVVVFPASLSGSFVTTSNAAFLTTALPEHAAPTTAKTS